MSTSRMTPDELAFCDAAMPVLCQRTHKLLREYGVDTAANMEPECDGKTVACSRCQHTALQVHAATKRRGE